jgi:hypothetical protein
MLRRLKKIVGSRGRREAVTWAHVQTLPFNKRYGEERSKWCLTSKAVTNTETKRKCAGSQTEQETIYHFKTTTDYSV